MSLFLLIVGADFLSIFIIFVLIFIFGVLVFWISRKVLRKVQKDASNRKINILSSICGVLITPVFLVVLAYGLIELRPKKSEEESTRHHYESMEKELSRDIKIGMSKTQIVELFGENDTTQSIMEYDLSIPEAKGKYILELNFEDGRLTNFERK